MTPVQISRNLLGLLRMPDPSQPSPLLQNMVRLEIAAEMIAEDQACLAAEQAATPSSKPHASTT